jgi:hypothetical protein
MLQLGRVVRELTDAYVPRFGEEFAGQMVRGARVVVIGAWVMVVALVLLVVGAVATIVVTRSLSDGFLTAVVFFAGIIVGFVIQQAGKSVRTNAISAMSSRIMAFDPNVTTVGASHLIHSPQLYDRWMSQHPGFVSH